MLKRPFDLGDRVEVNGRTGDVIDVGAFHTTLLEVGEWVKGDQSTGRIVFIPNSEVFRHSVTSYTKGFPFIWSEFSVVVTYESDWQAAKDILLSQAEAEAQTIRAEVMERIRAMQHRYAIHYEHLTPTVYTTIADQGIELTLRFLSPVRQRRTIAHRIAEGILQAFAARKDIDFAYPTTRIYRNLEEGKSAINLNATHQAGNTILGEKQL